MVTGFEYLKNKRKLSDESIRTFHLGYCDPEGNLYVDTDFPSKSLELDPRKFGNTALFPICNLYGELVGVSARNLKKELNKNDLKYVNTVYQKTDHLYGLNIAWPYILKEKTAYVVEGNVDVIMLNQHGIKNTVGMLSSVMKLKQFCLLMRFAEHVVIIPDGDDAGSKIVDRIKEKILKGHRLDLKITVLNLPKSYDPDSYIQEHGKDSLLSLDKRLLYEKGVFL